MQTSITDLTDKIAALEAELEAELAKRRAELHIGLERGRAHAAREKSGRPFPAVSFLHLSVERPFDKFHGINSRPKLSAKLLDRFIHRWRQLFPPVKNLAHRVFDGSQHFLYSNFTVGLRHSALVYSSSR
jgi:hypothetical protein